MTTKSKGGLFLWVPNNLKVVCEAIDKGSKGLRTVNEQFVPLLKSLTCVEKWFVSTYFCRLAWNVGSAKVLGHLNRLRILTATEYILSLTDQEHIQLILNDFLETEFDLMENLIINGHFDVMTSSKVTEYIDESIRRLFVDLAKDPSLNNMEYLNALKYKLPKNLHTKFVVNHLRPLLSTHKNSLKEAFANFSIWITQNLGESELVQTFYEKGVAATEVEVVKELLNISAAADFKGWRNYLLLLGFISKNGSSHCSSFIKKRLKDRIEIIAERGSVEIMAHLLLSIRVVLLLQEEKTENYDKWFKQNIGDMKFVLNTTEFKTMMKVLTDLVPYETDEEYLGVHVKTSISPPALCSELCRDYKQLCRTRIADIVACTSIIENDEDLFNE